MSVESSKHILESMSGTGPPTQKLVGEGRERYIQHWQQRAKKAIRQVTPSTKHHLSIIVVGSNRQENIKPLLESLQKVFSDVCVEVIFVGDVGDMTLGVIKDVARTMNSVLFQIHMEQHPAVDARNGGMTIVDGLYKAQAEHIAVIPASLQLHAQYLRMLYDQAVAQKVDLAVASLAGKRSSQSGLVYRGVPVHLKWLARQLFPGQLRNISDPWSNLFLLRRELLADVTSRPISHNVLLELLVRSHWQQVLEVHYNAQVDEQSGTFLQESRQTWRHMLRLWREVPTAGRIWKISLALLLNFLLLFILFIVDRSFSWLLSDLGMVVFAALAGLDFVVFNRFIFPSPIVRRATHSFSIAGNETIEALAQEKHRNARIDVKPKLRTVRKISDGLLSLVSVALVIAAIGWIGYTRPGGLLVPAVLFIGLAIVFARNMKSPQAITMLLAIGTGVATIDYVSWRFVVTNWSGWWIAVPLLFAETLGAIHGLGFQFTVWPWSPPKLAKGENPTLHPIFIFIPTVNEGVAILRPTLEGIIAAREKYLARYPHGRVTIVLCNDGRVAKAPNWRGAEALAQELGVLCITRAVGGGAKAGNIENARQVLRATGDALLVIFDADQVAKPDFLLKTIPPFRDPKMGWVQTGQYYANLDNPVSRWADDQQSMFYNLLCPGKAALNAAFICGTNVVIRAAALDGIGGLPQNSVTEDFAASIVLHRSWRSIYLTDVLATGLGPLDVPSYLKQQGRWAMGTLGVLRSHWRDIFLPKKKGLRMGQRFHYFLACTHYLCGLRDLVYLISPILFIFTGIPAVRGTTIGEYLWHFLPFALISAIGMWYASRNVTGLRGIVIGFGSFPVLIGSLLSVILQRKVTFAVTSKQRGGKRSPSYLSVYFVALLLCVVSLFWAILVQQRLWVVALLGQYRTVAVLFNKMINSKRDVTSLFISVLWVIYSMVTLGSFLWLNFRDLRFHRVVQSSKTTNETIANQPYPAKLLKRRAGLNPLWNLGLAVLLAGPLLVHDPLTALMSFGYSPPAKPFVLTGEKAPYFGVSLPVQLLEEQRAQALEGVLGTQFSIVGRTQDISDRFDTSWANQLAEQQARPWVTLQFGEFSCRDRLKFGGSSLPESECHNYSVTDCLTHPEYNPCMRPPLDANLPAIIHGLHDQELKMWAEDIRNYGKPVYMTILLQVDKNWSVTSAVANGGIPQDVSKAWTHVQSVFRAVGANNVAWVWAPADPLHDQPYAPPLSTIDAVLQDFINYSGDKWGNPQEVLQDLVARYPTKPIIVEASVEGNAMGPSARKAAWLTQLGQVINTTPQVYALLYHEGGPDLKASEEEIQRWSLSDPDSLSVVRHIISVKHQKSKKRG